VEAAPFGQAARARGVAPPMLEMLRVEGAAAQALVRHQKGAQVVARERGFAQRPALRQSALERAEEAREQRQPVLGVAALGGEAPLRRWGWSAEHECRSVMPRACTPAGERTASWRR
jgi:hypothetical protein